MDEFENQYTENKNGIWQIYSFYHCVFATMRITNKMVKTPKLGQKTFDVRDPKQTPLTVTGVDEFENGIVKCSYYCNVSMDEVTKDFKSEVLFPTEERKVEFGW